MHTREYSFAGVPDLFSGSTTTKTVGWVTFFDSGSASGSVIAPQRGQKSPLSAHIIVCCPSRLTGPSILLFNAERFFGGHSNIKKKIEILCFERVVFLSMDPFSHNKVS